MKVENKIIFPVMEKASLTSCHDIQIIRQHYYKEYIIIKHLS